MSLGSQDDDEDDVVSTINTTPLVDVMLVLLIIFLITVPVVGNNVPLTLPKERNAPTENKTGYISLSVTRDGEVFWGDRLVPDLPALLSKLEAEAVKVPQPEVRLRGDTEARYEHVGRVIYTLQRAGIQKIGFVTEPPVRGE